MGQQLIIRNKAIGEEELDQIRTYIHKHWYCARTYISKELCRLWDWRQDNGALKDQVCRILLRTLEDKGLIELPPRLRQGVLSRNRQYYAPGQIPLFAKKEFHGRVCDLPAITLRLARRNHEEKLWNYLVKVILETGPKAHFSVCSSIRHCIRYVLFGVLNVRRE